MLGEPSVSLRRPLSDRPQCEGPAAFAQASNGGGGAFEPGARGGLRLGPGALRMLLALLVFVSHVSSFEVGTSAVMIFFMLSGYWVTAIIASDRYEGVPSYIASRLWRLWPMVIICAAVAVGIHLAVEGRYGGSIWSTLFFLGLASRKGDVIGTTWSLDIELQFYILLPLVAAGLAAAGRHWLPWLIAGSLASFAIGAMLGQEGFITVLFYAPLFAAGIALHRSQWVPGPRLALFSTVGFGLAFLLYAIPFFKTFNDYLSIGAKGLFVPAIIVGLLAIPAVAVNVHVPSGRFDRWLGDLSFPFYLLHFPVIFLVATLLGTSLEMKLFALVLSLALTVAISLLLDRPIETLRRRTLAARKAGASGPAKATG